MTWCAACLLIMLTNAFALPYESLTPEQVVLSDDNALLAGRPPNPLDHQLYACVQHCMCEYLAGQKGHAKPLMAAEAISIT